VGHGSPSRSLPSLYLYLCLWGHRGKPKKRGREENVGEMGENGERAGEECGISTMLINLGCQRRWLQSGWPGGRSGW